jgi:hypothetical protein
VNLKDQLLVVAPHEGLVPSEVWLAVRRKLMNNPAFKPGQKAKNTWLAGKIKCGFCGTSLSANNVYYYCRRKRDNKSCEGAGKLYVAEVEDYIYREMRRKMADFQVLMGGNPAKHNPKLTAKKIELAQVEAEIEQLLDTLTGASKTLLSYANGKIETLDAQRQSLLKAIADMTAEAIPPERMKQITGYLNDWGNVSFDDKRLVVDGLILTIRATSDTIRIEWKI